MSFNASKYKDPFIADLVTYVGAKDFQSDFEAFFLKYAMEFSWVLRFLKSTL